MSARLLALLCLASVGCEWRPFSIVTDKECVNVVPGSQATIIAQVLDGTDKAVSDAKISWQLDPAGDSVVIDRSDKITQKRRVDRLLIEPAATAVIAARTGARLGDRFTLLVLSDRSELLTTRVQLQVADRQGSCEGAADGATIGDGGQPRDMGATDRD